jgi:hypothetical protein
MSIRQRQLAGDLRLLIATVLGRGIGMDHVSARPV